MTEKFDPRKVFGQAVTEVAEQNKNVVVLSADSGKSSGFGDFMKKYPERYYECGIMEQGVVGIAAGMATVGMIPVFCAIAPFVTCRPYEMVRNDIGYMRQNVKLVGRNCGFSYSDLGATHQSLDDFAIMRMIPGMTILAPQDPNEIKAAVRAMIEHEGPVYMRVGNPKISNILPEKEFVIGKGTVLEDGEDITIISTGSTTEAALTAAKELKERGISVRVIGMPTVYPLDTKLVEESAKKTGVILTVEEHYAEGGLGTLVTEACSAFSDIKVYRLGVPAIYAATGSYPELLHYYHIDAEGIAGEVKKVLSK